MYIENYFKSGKPKKHIDRVKSLEGLMVMFEDMNEGKVFKESEVSNNFSKRNIVFDDGTKENLWEAMKKFGFKVLIK